MPQKKKNPPSPSTGNKASLTVLDKIILAIRSQPSTHKGISRTSITKYLKSELDYTNASALKKAFQNGVSSGKLIQSGQSFAVAGDPLPEIPQDEKIEMTDTRMGQGDEATPGSTVIVAYEGHLDSMNGPVFDSASKFDFCLGAGDVIKGWEYVAHNLLMAYDDIHSQGVAGMKVGGKRELIVPPKLGYGKRGSPPDIPPNATLYFKVELKQVMESS